MGSIPNGSAPLQACARQIFNSMLPGRTGKAQVWDLNFESQDIPVNVVDFYLAGLRSACKMLASSLLRQFKQE